MVKLSTQVTLNANTPERLAAYDRDRTSLAFVKVDNQGFFIGTDEELTAANGFLITGSGGTISFADLLGSDPRLEYFGIVSAGTGDIRVLKTRSPILAATIRLISFFLKKSGLM